MQGARRCSGRAQPASGAPLRHRPSHFSFNKSPDSNASPSPSPSPSLSSPSLSSLSSHRPARVHRAADQNTPGVKGSKNDKLTVKVQRLVKEMEQAQDAYKAGVTRLEQLQTAWEEDTVVAASLFEALEAERLSQTKVAASTASTEALRGEADG